MFVGGNAVSVGIAACVSATIVKAAATAVDCASSGLKAASVGAELPHALSNRLSMAIPAQTFFFIWLRSLICDFDSVFVKSDRDFVVVMEGKFADDLSAAYPGNI